MSAILLFMAIISGIAGWWLVRQGLMSKPWLEKGVVTDIPDPADRNFPVEKVGLGIFLAVVGALFALFVSAYFMRMELRDWQSVPVPRVLWFNTAILILSSLALHQAVCSIREGKLKPARIALVAGGLTAVIFLAGQTVAWRDLFEGGYFLTSNPGNSFFYLLTGLHGLHILGGLVVLIRTIDSAWNGAPASGLRLSAELCAIYWHFLLFVWLVILVILAGWANDFIAICRQIIS